MFSSFLSRQFCSHCCFEIVSFYCIYFLFFCFSFFLDNVCRTLLKQNVIKTRVFLKTFFHSCPVPFFTFSIIQRTRESNTEAQRKTESENNTIHELTQFYKRKLCLLFSCLLFSIFTKNRHTNLPLLFIEINYIKICNWANEEKYI